MRPAFSFGAGPGQIAEIFQKKCQLQPKTGKTQVSDKQSLKMAAINIF
jgi:hypothetical protein